MAPTSSANSPTVPQEVSDFEKYFYLTEDRLNEIVKGFQAEFQDGLKNFGRDTAMIPSYCLNVPDGSETGTYLALDLGGTNLRVCEVKLEGNNQFSVSQRKYKITDELKHGEGRALFDYIADSVASFLSEIGTEIPEDEAIHLGFTFSFPVEQTALDKGTLLTWTKGFSAKNAVGHDVVKLLQDSLDAKKIHVRCSALVNDTVGTLLSRSYQSGPALVGAIFGTGTNGAYIDKTETITKMGEAAIKESLKGGKDAGEYMVVNTEWGAIDNGRKVLPVSMFDNKLDRQSINPRKQAFEKMVSGMYLGEIVRNILLHFIDRSILFQGHATEILNSHYGFDTASVSAIEIAKTNEEVKQVILRDLGVKEELVSESDIELVKWACKAVSTRAAQLAACAIAAVVYHTKALDQPEVIDIGLDGSVAEFLPCFEQRMRAALKQVLGEAGEKRITMGLAKDGSGVGAALCALQAQKAEINGLHPESKKMDPLFP